MVQVEGGTGGGCERRGRRRVGRDGEDKGEVTEGTERVENEGRRKSIMRKRRVETETRWLPWNGRRGEESGQREG